LNADQLRRIVSLRPPNLPDRTTSSLIAGGGFRRTR
jgi:hypothetical protein